MVGGVNPINIVLFSEINSKFGYPFFRELMGDSRVNLLALVTSAPGKLCDYYLNESDIVDLESEASSLGIPVYRPKTVNAPSLIQELKELCPDYFIIANYQQILKQDLLDVPIQDTINFHPSPLPRYAGLAPFFWMARNGERFGGVTALVTTVTIDGGPILSQREILLGGTEASLEIRDIHFRESLLLLKDVLSKLDQRKYETYPQDLTKRTYFGHPKSADYVIPWDSSQEEVLSIIRASSPDPGAITYVNGLHRFTVLEAESFEAPITPLQSPGSTILVQGKLLVATSDGWVEIKAIRNEEGPVNFRSIPHQFDSAEISSIVG